MTAPKLTAAEFEHFDLALAGVSGGLGDLEALSHIAQFRKLADRLAEVKYELEDLFYQVQTKV